MMEIIPIPGAEIYYDRNFLGDPAATHTYSRRKYKPLALIPEQLTL